MLTLVRATPAALGVLTLWLACGAIVAGQRGNPQGDRSGGQAGRLAPQPPIPLNTQSCKEQPCLVVLLDDFGKANGATFQAIPGFDKDTEFIASLCPCGDRSNCSSEDKSWKDFNANPPEGYGTVRLNQSPFFSDLRDKPRQAWTIRWQYKGKTFFSWNLVISKTQLRTLPDFQACIR